MANQLPELQVNSTPQDAFLIFNLLVFLPLLTNREAVSEDQSSTYVNYLYTHQISECVGRNSHTGIIVDSISCIYKPGEKQTKISIWCN